LVHAFGAGNGSILGGSEQIVVSLAFSESSVSLTGGLVILSEVSNNNNLIQSLEFIEVLLGDGGDSGEGLLHHVGNNTGALAASASESNAVAKENNTYASACRAPW
jgi:hypothetical protein